MNTLSTLAILPVKNLSQSKSRLSHEINRQQRESLAFDLLQRTLGILQSSRCIGGILMVSRDARVRSIAEMEGVLFLQEQALRKVIAGTAAINEMVRVLTTSKRKKQNNRQ